MNFFLHIFSFLLSSVKDKMLETLTELRTHLRRQKIAMTSSFALTFDERLFDKSDFLKYLENFDYIQYMDVCSMEHCKDLTFENILNEVKHE